MTAIIVPVKDDFVLYVGEASVTYNTRLEREVYTIVPPSISLFDQVLIYLNQQPQPPFTTGIQVRYLGVGLAALCIRWGSYLSSLLNSNALPHPTLSVEKNTYQPAEISYLNDSEMKRLNLEISGNIARLGIIYQANASDFYDLLAKAYHYLPMPFTTTRPNRDLEENLNSAYLMSSVMRHLHDHPEAMTELIAAGVLLENFQGTAMPWQSVSFDQTDRIIGNFLANFAWRDTLIEDYHAGGWQPGAPLLPGQRRFTEKDGRKVLQELCSNSAVIIRQIELLFDRKALLSHPLSPYIARYPASGEALYNSRFKWFYVYPSGWSLTEHSAPVTL